MTREEWNKVWTKELERGKQLLREEPPKEDIKQWLDWMDLRIEHAERISALDSINKEIILKELKERCIESLQSCINKLFNINR